MLAACAVAAMAQQTLNVYTGKVRWAFPAEQTGQMTYDAGQTLTVMGKTFAISEIDSIVVNHDELTEDNILVTYSADGAQVAVAGKEEYAADPIFGKAVEGRISKQLKEICLLDQEFVRADVFKGSVGGYIADVAKKLGAEIKAVSFVRFAKGEGIEKREDDFAAEVAGMMK